MRIPHFYESCRDSVTAWTSRVSALSGAVPDREVQDSRRSARSAGCGGVGEGDQCERKTLSGGPAGTDRSGVTCVSLPSA